MEKLPPQKKMSRKTPQNMEEIVGRWRNILVFGAKHGENAPAKKNVPENATKHGGTIAAEGKCPGTVTKPGKGCKISPFKWYICKR